MAIVVVVTFSTIDDTIFSMTTFATFYGLSSFIIHHKYFFNLGVIFSNCPKFKV
jgi:hypothetical protein